MFTKALIALAFVLSLAMAYQATQPHNFVISH